MPDNLFNTRIKKLSPLLINQLAAGEVVTRPAAVVKELLENAIDAGATHIEVRITEGGMGMIEVVDNGIGIHPDDMVMAITRHATSKVADVANLHGITTLGFRGEALAAMAAVSRLTLTSSHDDSGIGRQLQVAGVLAESPTLTPVVHKQGTTATVKDLYFNVPARRGHLKSIPIEFNHIETIVREVALARADVTLSLYHDNKKRLSLLASSTSANHNNHNNNNSINNNSHNRRLPLSRLEQALGTPLTESAIEIAVELSSLLQPAITLTDNKTANHQACISGWLWPSHNQQETLPKLLYINGRLVKEPIISNQMRQLSQSAQFDSLGYALYFELPYEWLNINVHPSKQRIKISPLNNIMAHLSHTIRLKLKTVDIPQTSASNASVKQSVDSNTSYDRFHNSTSQISSSSRQVQTPRQHYQYPAPKGLAKHSLNHPMDSNVNQLESNYKSNDGGASNGNNNGNGKGKFLNRFDEVKLLNSNISMALPYCLDIIKHLPAHYQANLAATIKLTPLPWLLFHSEGQLLLISEQDWRKHLALLFESNAFENAKTLASAADINQQIYAYATQMSAQDMRAFTSDVKEIFTTNAIKVIDTTQLAALMLSSSPI